MNILLLTSLDKNPAFEQTLTAVAKRNGWRLTVVRPGSKRTVFALSILLGILSMAVMLVSYYLLRIRFRPPVWVIGVTLLGIVLVLIALQWGVTRLMTIAQMRGTVQVADSVVMAKKPNMVVALGYGCVVVLENEVLRQLPLLMLSPNVIEYSKQLSATAEEQTLLNLEDAPFAYVTYDTTQSPNTIRESMLLADTAEPGACDTDLVCLRYADESKLENIVSYTFSRGWSAIAQREGVRVAFREEDDDDVLVSPNLAQILVDDEKCQKFFFKESFNGDTTSPWLSQPDLRLLLTLPKLHDPEFL